MDLSELNTKQFQALLEQIAKIQNNTATLPASASNKYKCTRPKRQTQKKLNEYEIEQVVAGYKTGKTIYELADRFGCHRTTISSYLKDKDVKMRRIPLDDEKIQEAVHLYESGLSLVKVGEIVDACAKTVRTRLCENGVAIRSPYDWKRKLSTRTE